ncbi:hypothetical protein LBMAG41_11600 [Cyanobium sp.]|nr:hypothetical protein LBMAG41_11600 [Cyanobium sp.]
MADFSIDLDILRAASIKASGGSGLAQLRLRASDGPLSCSEDCQSGQDDDDDDDDDGDDDYSPAAGNAASGQLVWVSLYLSTDGRFGTDDSLLVRRQVKLKANSDKVLKFKFATADQAVADGSYYLIARVESPTGVVDVNPANNQSVELVNGRGSDVILTWISCALNAIQSAGSYGKPGVPPTTGTRLMAMLSTAMLDAVAAFGNTVNPYRFDLMAPSGASRQAAVVGAAQRILALELPGESDIIQAQLSKSLAELNGSNQGIQAGLAFGAGLADQVRASRASDGYNNNTPYTPPANGLPGYVWMPATSGPTAGVALGANWGSVTPWVISGPDAYQSNGLQSRPDVDLDAYATQLNEVRQLGGLASTAVTSIQRTADQTEIAYFWAYDRPDTFRPYGQLIDIAMDVAAQKNSSLETNARLISCLSIAMADAVICAWKEKYSNVQPRPADLLTGAFSDTDGVASTVRDSQWQSLLSSINGVQSPPFPDFLSGHSVMGGAFASVMTQFFGDNVVFSARSVEVPGVERSFDGRIAPGSLGDLSTVAVRPNSFYEAGLEDAVSRVYGGVHIREACLDSFNVGLKVGDAVARTFLG